MRSGELVCIRYTGCRFYLCHFGWLNSVSFSRESSCSSSSGFAYTHTHSFDAEVLFAYVSSCVFISPHCKCISIFINDNMNTLLGLSTSPYHSHTLCIYSTALTCAHSFVRSFYNARFISQFKINYFAYIFYIGCGAYILLHN